MRPFTPRFALRNPLPEGALAVGAWMLLSGIATYAFLAVAGRALGPERYGALSALWAMAFLIGPGVFMPLEQEVARGIAARRAQGVGSGPLVRRAITTGLSLAAVLLILVAAFSTVLAEYVFDDQYVLVVSLALVLTGYAVEHLARGVLGGNARFGRYGALFGIESLLRAALAVALFVAGTTVAGPYGLVLGVAPFVASGLALRGQKGLATPGPPAPWGDLGRSLGHLLAGSLLAQFIVNAGPIAVQVLEGDDQGTEAGRFLAALVVARIPLYLFQAVQAALLPKLASLHTEGRHHDFRSALFRLVLAVSALGAVATVVAVAIGPQVVELFFGEDFVLARRDLGMLAAGSAAYMLALTLAQALIAVSGHARATVGWALGAVTFVVVVVVGNDLLFRVELGFLAAAATAAVAMAALLIRPLRTADKLSVEQLTEAIADEVLEP